MSSVAVQKVSEIDRLLVPAFDEFGNTAGKRVDEIRQRAYELFEQRGGENGRDLEDWLKAEQEVLGLPPPGCLPAKLQ